MRTTVDLDPELLDEVIKKTGEATRGKALNRIMEEYLRQEAAKALLAARGTFDLRDNWEEWEEAELEADREHARSRGGNTRQ